MRSKKEISRLAGVTMRFGSFRVSLYGREHQLYCPVHLEAKRARNVGSTEIPTHRFSVFQHYPRLSDQPLLKRDIEAALTQHLADMDEDGTPCDDLTKAVHG